MPDGTPEPSYIPKPTTPITPLPSPPPIPWPEPSPLPPGAQIASPQFQPQRTKPIVVLSNITLPPPPDPPKPSLPVKYP